MLLHIINQIDRQMVAAFAALLVTYISSNDAEGGPRLGATLALEAANGLPLRRRCAMRLDLLDRDGPV